MTLQIRWHHQSLPVVITHVVDAQEGAVVLVAEVLAVGELVAPEPEVDAKAVVAGE